MTKSFLLQNTCNYISLNFIMSLHLTNEIHEIRCYPCVHTFEKEIQEIRKLILPPWLDFRYKNNKDLFIGGDLPKVANRHGSWACNHMHRQQLTCLRGSQTITVLHDELFMPKRKVPLRILSEIPTLESWNSSTKVLDNGNRTWKMVVDV